MLVLKEEYSGKVLYNQAKSPEGRGGQIVFEDLLIDLFKLIAGGDELEHLKIALLPIESIIITDFGNQKQAIFLSLLVMKS